MPDHDEQELDDQPERVTTTPPRVVDPDELVATLTPLLMNYLPRQRWFANESEPTEVTIRWLDLRRNDPLLAWMVVDVTAEGSDERAAYQLVVAGRPALDLPDFLQGKERVTLGQVNGTIFYDALVDPDLALDVLDRVAPDEHADVARPLVVEQSNSSVVYDERLILKLFRRLHDEPNPDVEINRVLGERGFPHVVPQRAELRRDGVDLAVVRDYMLASNDAWQLAHTSLRDLLASRLPPDEAGADFGPEAVTLGGVTAALHVAMAEAFGTHSPQPDQWLASMHAQLDRTRNDAVDHGRIAKALERLVSAANPGSAIRVHGDLHLGQFLQGDSGWFVLDFEGEPGRPMAERVLPSSPLVDVAGMMRSFHYAAEATLVERGRDVDAELAELASEWEERAVAAFWAAYRQHEGVSSLIPDDERSQDALLQAFELEKAVYEVAYELAHRPGWVGIPTSAIGRILDQVA